MNYDAMLRKYTELTEGALKKYLSGMEQNAVSEAMEYSVSAGGKRLRPVILLSSCEAFSGCCESAMPFAAAIEMLHTYSLIHDDLPAMDNDDFRRGKPSCHKKHGEANAILAGDALLNRAFETVFSALLECGGEKLGTLITAAAALADASGINGMVAGQAADILYEETDVDERILSFINERKTGALISASFYAGAVVGGADDDDARAFAEAGKKVGAAFQIRDDVLDGEGSLETLGKPAGSDARNGKTTYYTLLGAKECDERIGALTRGAVSLLKGTRADTHFLECLIMSLVGRSK